MMGKRGKLYTAALKEVDKEVKYEVLPALTLLKKIAYAKFDETVEAVFRLGIDTKKADQQVRGSIVLPNGTGQNRKVIVIANQEKAAEAKRAGADFVGAEELLEKIGKGWLEFDVVIATPDMMAKVGALGRVLGPRGLMPNPKMGTVTFEVERAVKDVKAGKADYKADKAGNVHVVIGKKSFTAEKLADNLKALVNELTKVKPAAAKGTYMKKLTVSTSMGPSVNLNVAELLVSKTA
ncbi:MAG: ribosomal protein [Bacillota bacterium]|jgi:large subunit ribosomal protein L1